MDNVLERIDDWLLLQLVGSGDDAHRLCCNECGWLRGYWQRGTVVHELGVHIVESEVVAIL